MSRGKCSDIVKCWLTFIVFASVPVFVAQVFVKFGECKKMVPVPYMQLPVRLLLLSLFLLAGCYSSPSNIETVYLATHTTSSCQSNEWNDVHGFNNRNDSPLIIPLVQLINTTIDRQINGRISQTVLKSTTICGFHILRHWVLSQH